MKVLLHVPALTSDFEFMYFWNEITAHQICLEVHGLYPPLLCCPSVLTGCF